jgi:ParB-like chromosome segregation protein Spo0J
MKPIFKLKKNLYKTIPLANIHPHPAQPPCRTSDKNMQGLASVIMSTGRIDPPVVMPIPGRPGHYWMCNGNRR